MALVIPSQGKGPLSRLVDYPKEKLEVLASALETISPSLSLESVEEHLVAKAGISASAAQEIIRLLMNLYLLPELTSSVKRETLVEELIEAMQTEGTASYSPADSDWAPFKNFLTRVLALDTPIGTTARATLVFTSHERVYCEASIFTDLRPVFKSGGDEPVTDEPAALMPSHTLKLTYHHGSQRKDIFIAMDRGDLNELEKLITRARSKEDQLRTLARKTGALFLEVEQ